MKVDSGFWFAMGLLLSSLVIGKSLVNCAQLYCTYRAIEAAMENNYIVICDEESGKTLWKKPETSDES